MLTSIATCHTQPSVLRTRYSKNTNSSQNYGFDFLFAPSSVEFALTERDFFSHAKTNSGGVCADGSELFFEGAKGQEIAMCCWLSDGRVIDRAFMIAHCEEHGLEMPS